MLIFDQFANRQQAEKFAATVNGQVFDDQVASNSVDPFPYQLSPPIVLVPRGEHAEEDNLIAAGEQAGGHFAGT